MRIYGSLEPLKLSASDFSNNEYIGLKVKIHPRLGQIVLVESRSNSPKRYCIVMKNGYNAYFLSYEDAVNAFNNITKSH